MSHEIARKSDAELQSRLRKIVARIIVRRQRQQLDCRPVWIAAEALTEIHRERILPDLGRDAPQQTLLRLAREMLGVDAAEEEGAPPATAGELRADAGRLAARADALGRFILDPRRARESEP